MRWMLVVMAMALAGCGGADDGDGDVFGGAADAGAAVHYGPHGLPDCEVTCGADNQAVCPAPGKIAADLDGMYTIKEKCSPCGSYGEKVLTGVAETGRTVAYCHTPGDVVTFKSR